MFALTCIAFVITLVLMSNGVANFMDILLKHARARFVYPFIIALTAFVTSYGPLGYMFNNLLKGML